MRFISLLLLGICECGENDVCTVVCVACVYAERVRGYDNYVGVGDRGMWLC